MRVANTLLIRDGQVLLLFKEGRQKWFLPGGKSEFGEHVIQTGLREFQEETGLRLEGARLGAVTTIVVNEQDHEWLLFTIVGSGAAGELAPYNREGILQWHPVQDLSHLPMFEGDRYLILKLLDPKVHETVVTTQYYTKDYEFLHLAT
ncbi:MAG: NUDIX domain-containing protein [Turicibacter sp.]|nr:NUDIX domain-containing protein [Turicibacter sp.]